MEIFLNQFLALVCFFLFPIIQFFLLKKLSKKEGLPELWYLPDYSYRLVIRNMDGKTNLFDIKYKVYALTEFKKDVNLDHGVVAAQGSTGASIYRDLEQNDMPILMDGRDKAMICFKITGSMKTGLSFCKCDYLGNILDTIPLDPNTSIIAEYTAMIDNKFNFNVRVLKRVQLTFDDLVNYFLEIDEKPEEKQLQLNHVQSGGE